MTAIDNARLVDGATTMTRAQTIAQLNDAFRRGEAPGRLFVTPGVIRSARDKAHKLLALVRAFDAFTPDNDPYGEHDFGAVSWGCDERCFWKIDYYDPLLTAGSSDPTDPSQTTRVMTIMLASEY